MVLASVDIGCEMIGRLTLFVREKAIWFLSAAIGAEPEVSIVIEVVRNA